MKQKNVLILAIVWLLVMVSIVASAVTLLASGKSFELTRWVSREEYEMIERYSRLEDVRLRLSEGYFQEVSEEAAEVTEAPAEEAPAEETPAEETAAAEE